MALATTFGSWPRSRDGELQLRNRRSTTAASPDGGTHNQGLRRCPIITLTVMTNPTLGTQIASRYAELGKNVCGYDARVWNFRFFDAGTASCDFASQSDLRSGYPRYRSAHFATKRSCPGLRLVRQNQHSLGENRFRRSRAESNGQRRHRPDRGHGLLRRHHDHGHDRRRQCDGYCENRGLMPYWSAPQWSQDARSPMKSDLTRSLTDYGLHEARPAPPLFLQ